MHGLMQGKEGKVINFPSDLLYPKIGKGGFDHMKTYQVEIRETLCMTVEIEAENAQQAEAKVQEAYSNEEYILDAEHFVGVEFAVREKEIEACSRNQKRREYKR
jgi:hypothetical protein